MKETMSFAYNCTAEFTFCFLFHWHINFKINNRKMNVLAQYKFSFVLIKSNLLCGPFVVTVEAQQY